MNTQISSDKSTIFSTNQNINCRGELINFNKPLVMGILNITDDSFYDGGKYTTETNWLNQTQKMLSEGADIIDIGAASTRPGATLTTAKEEISILQPVIYSIRREFNNTLISVDTYHAETVEMCAENGVNIINDISGGEFDKNIFATIARLKIPYILMHIKGTPENMQQNPVYKNLIKEMIFYFSKKVNKLRLLGVNDIILDPGFGFGKTLEDNYHILQELDSFRIFELPILVGVSRKSMINKVLETTPDKALNGTTVLNTIALLKGASILRVHDVKEAVETVKLCKTVNLI